MRNFQIVPGYLYFNQNIKPIEREILAILISLQRNCQAVFPSHGWLADQLGTCRSTIRRNLKSLREKGAIAWESNKGIQYNHGRSNSYRVLINIVEINHGKKLHENKCKSGHAKIIKNRFGN